MLFKHQKEAFDRYKDASIIPLFFEVGTGKTRTALEIAAYKMQKGEINRVLVIAPNGVHVQWALQECPKWVPHLRVDYKRKGKVKPPAPDTQIYCANVDTFSTERSWYPIRDWVLEAEGQAMIILDEAQTIKNIKAKRTQNIVYGFNKVVKRGKAIKSSTPLTAARCVLTGTPVTRSPMDLWTIFEFMQPSYFNMGYYQFKSTFVMEMNLLSERHNIRIPINEQIWRNVKHMSSQDAANCYNISLEDYAYIQSQDSFQGPYKNMDLLKSLVYKPGGAMCVHLTDVIDMPEKTYLQRVIEMSPKQKQLCKEIQRDLYTQYGDHELDVPTILVARLRLAQIASGFISLDPNEEDPPERDVRWIDGGEAKMDALVEELASIVGEGQGAIVITRFSVEAERLYETLSFKYPGKVCLMTGYHKEGSIEAFQNGDYDIMIANIHLIARGYNLQRAHYMLFYSNSDSLEDRIQCEGRIYRNGQKNNCIYIDYKMKSSMDENILERLSMKKDVYKFFMDGLDNLLDSVL